MSEPRISIIIPAYNEERYLSRCLDSIAAQATKPYEVIVVDNNSTDATARIAGQYPFVKLVQEPQQGRVFARNAGFNAAAGTILARIDADAILPPDWLEGITDYFARPGASQTALTGGALFYNVRFPRIVSALYDGVAFWVNRLLVGYPSLWGSNMAFPRSQWKRVADQVCLRNDIHEDLDLTVHLHRAGCRIVYDSRRKVRVELRPAYAKPAEVWEYCLWWPRTLQAHGIRTWPITWVIAVIIYLTTPLFGVTERIARLFGRKPINQ